MYRVGLALSIILIASFAVEPALADPVLVQYTITGNFSADAGSAPLSGANGSYTLGFVLPQNPTPDYFDASAGDFALANVPIQYSFQCAGCADATIFSGPAETVDFANSGLGGMLVVEFLTGGHDYYWQFSGDQLFSGTVENPTLEACGPIYLTDSGVFELDAADFVNVGDATVTGQIVSTPEPSTRALLFSSGFLFGLFCLAKALRS